MTVFKSANCKDEWDIVYYCDCCGGSSNFSDYWWPGCYHWEELNYTLCNDCLRILATIEKENMGESHPYEITSRYII